MSAFWNISSDIPVLVTGPTASGKSSLALEIASRKGGAIVNADAMQVYQNWRILTARPSKEDEAAIPHLLYGHIAGEAEYSVGHWLRELRPLMKNGPRPIIVGGTGLYFHALTEGLAEIPPVPNEVRHEAETLVQKHGLSALLSDLDSATLSDIDEMNPMRVQRAWEVHRATGKSISKWRKTTEAPLLPLSRCIALAINAPVEWLNPRIEARFDMMVENGAIEEASRNRSAWNPEHPSSKAIGARELIRFIDGECSLESARNDAIVATRQYAKRQRSWFRARMKSWHWLNFDEF
ncbi:MAG: tRNA (adenosine(37)-N6)-dimethylallyltransferase MiaA [Roseovarius sp.]|nr:tRNA (adenosine(37)-N6)-dimethylallyltransferase MiaA [Roseovarius sp.]